MLKLAAVALTGLIGVSGIAASGPAEAHPCLTVGAPGFLVAPGAYAPGYYGPYPYVRAGYGPYWHRDFDRYRYEHFHHGFERGYRRW